MGYNLYLAETVGAASDGDDRIQVRVLPQMEGIDSNMCPVWPYFFKDEMSTGKVGDIVWVVCDDEFSTGYILGNANYNTFVEDTYEAYSIPTATKEKISDYQLNLLGETLYYSNIKVSYWNSDCIHFIERSTGGSIIAFKSGTLYIMRPKVFLVKIGDTSFKMDAEGIGMVGSEIKIQSPKVGLGDNPKGSILVTNGSSSEGGIPSEYVKA